MVEARMHQVGAVLAVGLATLVALADRGGVASVGAGTAAESWWAAAVEAGSDHIGTRALADILLAAAKGGPAPVLVDVRPQEEYDAFHLPGAVRMSLPELLGTPGAALLADAAGRIKVLYSNGPAHPGQAWVELRQRGVDDVFVLDGGLDQFVADELTPPSLRAAPSEAAAAALADRTAQLRRVVLGETRAAPGPSLASSELQTQDQAKLAPIGRYATDPVELTQPTFVSTAWLSDNLARVVVVDTRSKAEDFAKGHIAGAVHAPIDVLRETRDGVGDELLLVPDLARVIGGLGIAADTAVVAYSDARLQDAAHFALAMLRLGHRKIAVLEGGLPAWQYEKRPLVTEAAPVKAVHYQPRSAVADFTVGLAEVKKASESGGVKILDTRPADQFGGKESTEARGGHIPGALNRPLAADTVKDERGVFLRPLADLRREYAAMGLLPDRSVIVSCRTGHQAAQTWFALRYLLGYDDVRWYDGSWKEWAAHPELPLETR